MIRWTWLVLAAVAGSLADGAIAQELDQNGKAHAWKGQSEGYVLIDFAASWCQPCWKALPRLQSFADSHPAVEVIVVSVDEREQGRDKLVKELALTIPVLWDLEHRVAEHYRPAGMPATFVLSPGGEIVYQHVGSGDREWREMLAFFDGSIGE